MLTIKNKFNQKGITVKNTVFVINHFLHNGKNVIHEKLEEIASKDSFQVAFDGMEAKI